MRQAAENSWYYKLQITDQGIVGLPQAIDLNYIGAPSAGLDTPPYGLPECNKIARGVR